MTKQFLIYSFLIFGYAASGQSLEYFVNAAKENHPELKSRNLQHQAVEKRIGQYSIWQDPVLSGAYNVTPNSMEKWNVSLMQNFSWFGTTKTQRKAVNAAVEGSRLKLLALQKQVEISVANAYLDVQETEALLKIQEKNFATYENLEKIAQNKLSTTKGTLSDVVRAEISKENAALEIDLLKLTLKTNKELLNSLTGRETNAAVEVEPIEVSDFISTETMLEHHPEVAAMDAMILENEALKAVAEKEAMPMFGLGVELMRMEPNRNEIMPMVSISLPIFRSKYKARIAETEALGESYKFEKQWIGDQLERQRFNLKKEIETANKEIQLYENQQQKTQRLKELLLNYYSTSGVDFQEVIRTQQEEVTYETERVKAEVRLLKAAKEWEYVNLD